MFNKLKEKEILNLLAEYIRYVVAGLSGGMVIAILFIPEMNILVGLILGFCFFVLLFIPFYAISKARKK